MRPFTRPRAVISTLGDKERPYTYDAVILEPISASDVLAAGVRGKRKTDLRLPLVDCERILSWLFEKQLIFGIAPVFHEGVEAYCREVLALSSFRFGYASIREETS